MSIFSEIKEAAGDEPRSYSWYRDNVRMYFQKTDLYTEMTNLEESMIPVPGQLYLFEYKATYARKLKYYDEFPLVYALGTGTKFLGANLHYLRHTRRMQTVLKLKEGILDIPKQCYHNYVLEGLETPLYRINSEDYLTSVFLPVENFVTRRRGFYQQYSKSAVWGETSQ